MIGRVLSVAALWVLRAVAALPYPVVRRVGAALGAPLWWFAVPRRRIALTNLRLCLPEIDEAARRRIARDHFTCFARTFVERFVFWFGPAERIRSLVRFEGIEHWQAHAGRPLILLAPHFLGLDAGGIRIQVEAHIVSMYARQKNRVLDQAMRAGRTRFNDPLLILRQDGLRPAVRAMRAGVPFYFLPDMDLGPRDAVFVPFFGVPAATVTSVARLARMTGAAVVPVVTEVRDDGYVTRFHPAWTDFPGDDDTAATARMNAFIEAQVREMPAQYLWSHKRFKTRPQGMPGVYR